LPPNQTVAKEMVERIGDLFAIDRVARATKLARAIYWKGDR
jgi:hypothetical protein